MNSTVEISVVIPVRNEAGAIEALVDEVFGVLDGVATFEIIVVDDASQDGSGEILERRSSRTEGMRVVHFRKHRGQSAALCAGVDVAVGGWIATLDGDGQNVPADIAVLYRQAHRYPGSSGHFAFLGQRYRRDDHWSKRLASRIANRVRACVLDDDVPDTGCGLKLVPRELFMRLPRFDHMHRFIPALLKREGTELICIPVAHRARRSGRSKYGIFLRFFQGLIDMAGVYWLQRRALVRNGMEDRQHDQ